MGSPLAPRLSTHVRSIAPSHHVEQDPGRSCERHDAQHLTLTFAKWQPQVQEAVGDQESGPSLSEDDE